MLQGASAPQYPALWKQILQFIRTVLPGQLDIDRVLVAVQGGEPDPGLTVLGQFCTSYVKQAASAGLDADWENICAILESFLQEFKPALTVGWERGSEVRSWAGVVQLAGTGGRDGYRGLRALLALATPSDLQQEDEAGNTALLLLIDAGAEDAVRAAVQAGAELDRVRVWRDPAGQEMRELPLERAVDRASPSLVQLLLELGANPLTQPATGNSILHRAVRLCAAARTRPALAVVRLLLSAGCDPGEQEEQEEGRTPLQLAVGGGRDEANRSLDLELALLAAGAEVGAVDRLGRTALHHALHEAGGDPVQVVSLLLARLTPATVQLADKAGRTALHWAARAGAAVSALLLLEHGAQLEARDGRGNTALALAVETGQQAVALTLLQRGADVTATVLPEEKGGQERCGRVWRHLPLHWAAPPPVRPASLLEGTLRQDWLGLTHLLLDRLPPGPATTQAALTAMRTGKFQFAKAKIFSIDTI